MPPQPSGVPPDFDRFPPLWLVHAHTPPLRLRQRADAALAPGVRGSSTTMPLTPKRSKSGASLTRCRSQSSRRRCAALLGRTAVPTVAGEILLRVGPRTNWTPSAWGVGDALGSRAGPDNNSSCASLAAALHLKRRATGWRALLRFSEWHGLRDRASPDLLAEGFDVVYQLEIE